MGNLVSKSISNMQLPPLPLLNKYFFVFYIIIRVGDAENIPLEDNSVDLITCSQAVHWFNFDNFFREVSRVLTPDGVLAVYSRGDYVLLHDNPVIEKELTTLYKEVYLLLSNQIKGKFPGANSWRVVGQIQKKCTFACLGL